MKIVYLANTRIPSRWASSVHVMKMCQAFAQNGHDVVLMTPTYGDEEPGVQDSFAFYGVERCFRLRKLPTPKDRLRGLLKYGTLATWLIAWERPDLVYARCHGLPLYPLSRLSRPVIVESHVLTANEAEMAELLRCPHLRHVVVISQPLREDYVARYGMPEAKIRVVHDAADEPRPGLAAPFDPSDRFQVGYVGNLYTGRGVELILELAQRAPWADFRLVGGTEKEITRIRGKVAAMGLTNAFVYGFVPPAQTDAFRLHCHVLMAPYQAEVFTNIGGRSTARWMSPLKIFEYMAAGRAVMASDLPVLKEVLTHGETAWLCRPDAVDDWLAGLTRLREDPGLRERLGSRAREVFLAEYTWKARVRCVL